MNHSNDALGLYILARFAYILKGKTFLASVEDLNGSLTSVNVYRLSFLFHC